MGIWSSIGRVVQSLTDERKSPGVPAGAQQNHRDSLRLQREYEAEYELRDEYGVGTPDLGGAVSPFTWYPMRFERHLQVERASGVIRRSDQYFLVSPEMLPQLLPWVEYLNTCIANARALASAIPEGVGVQGNLIRAAIPARVPSVDERPQMSLFSIETVTKTGKPAKYPLRLMLTTGAGRSDVNFLPDGSPGKIRIVLWAGQTTFAIECKLIGGKMTVSYVTRTSGHSKDRLYDYRAS